MGRGRLLELAGRLSRAEVVELAHRHSPTVVGIDSPRRCAPAGAASRECERRVARSVCGIRWTPDADRVQAGGYYEWVVEGLGLYRALEPDWPVIEVFPTASWTRWHGARNARPRSEWTRDALAALRLAGVPARTNQDQRDAIAAAVTAQQHSAGLTERLGEIVVPCPPSTLRRTR